MYIKVCIRSFCSFSENNSPFIRHYSILFRTFAPRYQPINIYEKNFAIDDTLLECHHCHPSWWPDDEH